MPSPSIHPPAKSTSIEESRREIAMILGWCSVPDAVQVRELGLFATFEMSFLRALESYPDDFIFRLVSALRVGSEAFLMAVTQMMFVNVRGWLKVTPLDARGLKRLDTILRYSSACEHAPHPEILQAAHTVAGWTRTMSTAEKEALVAVIAAARIYAADQDDSWKHFPKERSPIVQYCIDRRQDYPEIAAIVRQRGCDTELIDLMLDVTPSLLEGAL